jgi:hypothetical protein
MALIAGLCFFDGAAHAALALNEQDQPIWAQVSANEFRVTEWPAPESNLLQEQTASALAGSEGRPVILATPVVRPALALADIGLWQFISSVRAQQQGSSLTMLEGNLRILELATTPAVSPVPLPATAWFLVMGLLGLAGVKVTGRGESVAASWQAHSPAPA